MLPPEIGLLLALTRLNLEGCEQLKELPPEIGHLTALAYLSLEGCEQLKVLPPEIGQLTALTHLYLHGCEQLKELPPEIGLLTALAHLYLTGCTLEHYWQIYWASYWNSPSKLFTGRFTAHITGKKDYCPVTGVPVTTKHVTGAAVTTKREHMRASVNRQLGQLLCRAPECGLFWGMQPHIVGIRTAQGRVTCAGRTGVRGRCEPEGWHAR